MSTNFLNEIIFPSFHTNKALNNEKLLEIYKLLTFRQLLRKMFNIQI